MTAAVQLRTDYSVFEQRRLVAGTKHANRSRLLSQAAVLDGMEREQATRIGGMDRQTLRDWVHWLNESGPDGLKDIPRRENLVVQKNITLIFLPSRSPRTDPGREHLAVSARQPALKPRFRRQP